MRAFGKTPLRALRFSFLFSLLLGYLAPLSKAAVERVVEKTFAVTPGITLKVDTCQGVIRIEPSSVDNQIHVLVRQTINADNDAAADKRVQELDLRFEQTSTLIKVRARYRRAARWAWESWPPVALAYVVKVPHDCNVDLSTPEGDITVCSLKGSVLARARTGTIFAQEIDGTVQASSTRGDVSVTACTGALTLSTKLGNIIVGRANGLTKIDASGGLIEVQNARGQLHVDADGADIKIGFAHPLIQSADLRAAGGDIEAVFDPRSAGTLMVNASSFGAVKVKNLPLKLESGKTGSARVVGTLNGGGPKISIKASGGNVRLTGLEP